jgi:hypothetical protein
MGENLADCRLNFGFRPVWMLMPDEGRFMAPHCPIEAVRRAPALHWRHAAKQLDLIRARLLIRQHGDNVVCGRGLASQFRGRLLIECLWPGDEPSVGNSAAMHFVDRNQLNAPRTLRKSASDLFMIDDPIAADYPIEQERVKIGLFESSDETSADFGSSSGQRLRWMLELLGILSIGCHECFDIPKVVSFELSLHDFFRTAFVWRHCQKFDIEYFG